MDMIVNDDCTLCDPDLEVGCVTRDEDGLVACEGCRREVASRPVEQGRFIVMSSTARMPQSCWGSYKRVGVVELEPGFVGTPKMLSERARGVRRVVETWENCFVGKTERCAYERALVEAAKLAADLNSAVVQLARVVSEETSCA